MMTKIRIIMFTALVAVGIGGGLFVLNAFSEKGARCPGKITCPISGQVICRDQCPIGK